MKPVMELDRPAAPTPACIPDARRRVERERIHVLFLVDELTEMGGAERALLKMIRSLPDDRFRGSVVTFRIDQSLAIFNDFPCALHVLPLRKTYDWNGIRVALRLRRLIREEDVRIVHTFFETSDLWGGLIARLSGVRVLISSRRDMGILRRPKHTFLYRLVNPLFSKILAVSEEVRKFCIEKDGLSPGRVETLYNGVDIRPMPAGDRTALRAKLGLSGFDQIVLTLGNIRRVKGVDLFVRAAAEICHTRPNTMFLIVGYNHEPAHYEELRKLTEDLGITRNVLFYGPSEEVPQLLAASDVFCLPSRSEGFSNAVIEAMGAGLPCVATRVGGNAEAIEDGRNGLLAPSEDAAALARCIRELLEDPRRAAELGRQAADTVQARFTHEAMMKHLTGVYERLLPATGR